VHSEGSSKDDRRGAETQRKPFCLVFSASLRLCGLSVNAGERAGLPFERDDGAGIPIKNPLGCSDQYVLRYVAAANRFECLVTGSVAADPAGSNGQIQFDASGIFGATAGSTGRRPRGRFVSGRSDGGRAVVAVARFVVLAHGRV